jgi:hypothetical protein
MDRLISSNVGATTYHITPQTNFQHLEFLVANSWKVLVVHEPVLMVSDLVSAILQGNLVESWEFFVACAGRP